MVRITALWNNKDFMTKFYRQSSVQTRTHFIKSVKFDIIGKHDLLEVVNENKDLFIETGIAPYSDLFTYETTDIHIYGDIVREDYFFEYKFESDDGQNDYKVIYNTDSKRYREDFVKEVIYEFTRMDKLHLLLPYERELESFKKIDTETFYVTKTRFSMRREDDVETLPVDNQAVKKHDKNFLW